MNPRIFFNQISGLVIQAVLWITWCCLGPLRYWKLVYHTTKVCFQACHESTTKTSNHLIILWELYLWEKKRKFPRNYKKGGKSTRASASQFEQLTLYFYNNKPSKNEHFLILLSSLARYSQEPKLKRIFEILWVLFEEISVFYSDWPKSWIW